MRPATVRPEAIRQMDREEDDESGWAGEQEEVDFNAKLTWDDSDDDSERRAASPNKAALQNEGGRWHGQVGNLVCVRCWMRQNMNRKGRGAQPQQLMPC